MRYDLRGDDERSKWGIVVVEEKEERCAKVVDRRLMSERKFNPRNGISWHAGEWSERSFHLRWWQQNEWRAKWGPVRNASHHIESDRFKSSLSNIVEPSIFASFIFHFCNGYWAMSSSTKLNNWCISMVDSPATLTFFSLTFLFLLLFFSFYKFVQI